MQLLFGIGNHVAGEKPSPTTGRRSASYFIYVNHALIITRSAGKSFKKFFPYSLEFPAADSRRIRVFLRACLSIC